MTEGWFIIAAGSRAPLEARRQLDALIEPYPAMLRFDARLCLTELVTNALEHSDLQEGDDIGVEVHGDDAVHLRLDVSYPGAGFVPRRPRPVTGTEKGRGLALVEAVSDAWGASSDRGHVWVELDARADQGDGSTAATSADAGSTRLNA
jgi:anti-sigma regulatory factor (Ser/Thr protein kinase)